MTDSGNIRSVMLADVCDRRIESVDPRRSPEQSFRYVDITSVDNARKRIIEPRSITGREAPSRARQRIKTGDVLVATTRPNLNAVALVPPELDGQIASTGFCVLRPADKLDADYLFAFVQSGNFVKSLSDLVKGALYPAVSDNQVFLQTIPFPPLLTQRRIAAQLKAQLAEVECARAALQAQIDTTKNLPKASLRTVFEDHARKDREHWPSTTFGKVCEIVARQVDPKLPEYSSLPHVNGENIESGTHRLTNICSAAEDGMTSGKYLFDAGDVLYSKLRPYLRKVAPVDFRGLCSADMYPLRPNAAYMDSDYMAWMLVSDGFTHYAVEESQRARMPKINREELFAWTFALPPLAVQRTLAAQLKSEIAAATALRAALEVRLTNLNRLPAALLRQVFGETEDSETEEAC